MLCGQYQFMKIIILLCTAILLGGCTLVELAQQVPTPNDVDGVIKCISDKAATLADASPEGFCGKNIAENRECYSNFNSLNLCLLNNKCLFHKDDTSISVQCWNCWKDVPYTSDQFVQLQKDIAGCSEQFTHLLALLLLALVALL